MTSDSVWAWGLYTHVWFAQALLWLVPLTDPRFRTAARQFPRLVLAGACLPDLALVRRVIGEPGAAVSATHDWALASRLLKSAREDESRALALGFASHLLTDIYAHNHFVPAHEKLWGHWPVLTHAGCEWALDHHVRDELFATPATLLKSEQGALAGYVAGAFDVSTGQALSLIQTLGRADRVLRVSQLPVLAHGAGRLRDRGMQRRFRYYLSQTVKRLPQINPLIEGAQPAWHANPPSALAHGAIAGVDRARLRARMPLPDNVFAR